MGCHRPTVMTECVGLETQLLRPLTSKVQTRGRAESELFLWVGELLFGWLEGGIGCFGLFRMSEY